MDFSGWGLDYGFFENFFELFDVRLYFSYGAHKQIGNVL